ncbi:acyl carrier protein, partial [Aliarcobacter butzleri]|uniref:acyl carrier protein n=1 Tax=Aliarcobacter butzleri TaxID=28197 RepID=UPI003AF4C7E0
MALLDDVKSEVVEKLYCDSAEVKVDSKFIEDLSADSLDVVVLVMTLEEKFVVEIPVDDPERIITVVDD